MSDHSRRLRAASDLENSGDLGVNRMPNLTITAMLT